ncbi:MAG: transcriptional regulator [Bacteroidetes bacterium]|nr:MAG: transcriptional regulator [Bacteroidota bacterium]
MITQALKQEVSQLEADLCYALADSTRILILFALDEKPYNVTDLGLELGINQSTTSRHLKILRDRGVVQTTREGKSIIYHLADSRLIEALNLLRAVLRDGITHKAEILKKIHRTEN